MALILALDVPTNCPELAQCLPQSATRGSFMAASTSATCLTYAILVWGNALRTIGDAVR